MHSPKFPIKAKSLRYVVNVWQNLDFHTRIDAICTAIESEVLSATYIPNPPIRFLSEKSKGLCRQLVIPSVKDALVLQTLSDSLWAEIRTKAPTKKSFYAPGDHQFSKVIKGHSSEYGSLNAWLAFQEKIFGFAKAKKYVIVTDIANYYDSVSYDHLRNILADLSLAREHALDLLIYTLSCMLWQPDYMPRVPVGLPQSNLDAPRLLAHCFLFEIDELLSNMKNVDFARYMDDIDVGVDSIPEARVVIRDLDLSLQTRQIRLNSGKTKILTEKEAREHFKIRENMLIDKLAERIDAKLSAKKPLDKERRQVELAIRGGLRRGTFLVGNGDKIFKRLVNLARQLRANLSDETFLTLLRDWPALRPAALSWLQHSAKLAEKLPILSSLTNENAFVDDAAKIDIAVTLVSARLPIEKFVEDHVRNILESLDQKSAWDFYAKGWILSKYGTVDELMAFVETSVSLWVAQEHLSRLVAGLFPRFVGTSHHAKFEAIIRRAGNAWSMSVLQFHLDLASGTKGYTGIKNFVLAKNTSLPNWISHSKLLILLSLLNNFDLAPTAIATLTKVHRRALTDAYYARLVSAVKGGL